MSSQRFGTDFLKMEDSCKNLKFVDRKNFATSITSNKGHQNKMDNKNPMINKNYTFQNNSEAKKILSNINNHNSSQGNEGIGRASLNVNLMSNYNKQFEDPTNKSSNNLKKLNPNKIYLDNFELNKEVILKNTEEVVLVKSRKTSESSKKNVILVGEDSTPQPPDSNLFEWKNVDSVSKNSPKFNESQVSDSVEANTKEVYELSFENKQLVQTDIAEDKSEDPKDPLAKDEKAEVIRTNPDVLEKSLLNFADLETKIYEESQKMQFDGEEEGHSKLNVEPRDVSKTENEDTQQIEPQGIEIPEMGEIDFTNDEPMDFEMEFLGANNALDQFWEPDTNNAPMDITKENEERQNEEDKYSVMSGMSIQSEMKENFHKIKEETIPENLSHLKLEEIMALNTMGLSMKSDKEINKNDYNLEMSLSGFAKPGK